MKEYLLEFEYTPNQYFEDKSKKKKSEKKHEKKEKHSKKEKYFSEDSEEYKMIESQIEDFFEGDGVDIAPYAYKLFHIRVEEGKDTTEMKNARSLFYKKLHHEENSEGYVYSFTSEELIHLQSLISDDSSLSESKKIDFLKRIVEGYNTNKHLIK